MSDLTGAWPPSTSQPSSTTAPERLHGDIRLVHDLTAHERNQMFALLTAYFTNTTRPQFDADLAEKTWAILLRDQTTGQIVGFSTLMRFRIEHDGQPVEAIFSGDTIIARPFWGDTVLPRLWARHVFGLAATVTDAPVYWFLISSGYKTYRFLSTFFRDFVPTFRYPTPSSHKRLLDRLGAAKFGSAYDPATGIVRFSAPTPLRDGVAGITERQLADPHVAFFAAANPGHVVGDELACLTLIDPANLTPAGRRMLR